jgi:hyaluronan synthase
MPAGVPVDEVDSSIELPQVKRPVETTGVQPVELSPADDLSVSRDDLFAHCRQRISSQGRLQVSRKAWLFRILFLSGMIAFMAYNIRIALAVGDPLIIYTTVMPVHALMVLVIGWVFYKNPATGKVPDNLVSVIIPVYNQEKLIAEVIAAVFQSTYHNIEVVAVNDGSKDHSKEVLEDLARQEPRLKVVNKANGGKRTAVAAGFFASRGDVVVLIDSDSAVDRYAIEEFMKVFSANPRVGGVVGNGKVLNADQNLLTRCQDTWYDYSFNIHKSTESVFGTVLCLSGCLAAYRREAISRFLPFWAHDKAQYGDDRNLTTYAIATPWAKGQLAPLERRLFKGMLSYDDAEDRGLTVQTMIQWKTVYAPTAVVYTEVPDNWKTYFRQQIRWRKGYLRSTFFMTAFFWRKNPLMAFLFYLEFMMTFIAPVITVSIFVYSPLFVHSWLFPCIYVSAHLLTGFAAGFDYKFRDPTSRNWIYKPVMNMISAFLLPWVLFPAIWGFRKNSWLTR